MQGTQALVPAARQVKDSLASVGQKFLAKMSQEVIVVPGSFDRVEDVLPLLDIEFKLVRPEQFDTRFINPTNIILINCPGRGFSHKGIQKIQYAVRAGCWLISTDWGLTNIIEQAFPRTIVRTGHTANDVVTIQPTESQIVKGVLPESEFWLENNSFTFGIVAKDDVSVLIESAELNRKYHSKNIMVGFGYGQGKVFHSISHFVLQQSKAGATRVQDAVSCLSVLTNILVQKSVRNQKGYE